MLYWITNPGVFGQKCKKSVNGYNSQIVSVDNSTEKQGMCTIFWKTLHSSFPYDIDQMCNLQEDIVLMDIAIINIVLIWKMSVKMLEI